MSRRQPRVPAPRQRTSIAPCKTPPNFALNRNLHSGFKSTFEFKVQSQRPWIVQLNTFVSCNSTSLRHAHQRQSDFARQLLGGRNHKLNTPTPPPAMQL